MNWRLVWAKRKKTCWRWSEKRKRMCRDAWLNAPSNAHTQSKNEMWAIVYWHNKWSKHKPDQYSCAIVTMPQRKEERKKYWKKSKSFKFTFINLKRETRKIVLFFCNCHNSNDWWIIIQKMMCVTLLQCVLVIAETFDTVIHTHSKKVNIMDCHRREIAHAAWFQSIIMIVIISNVFLTDWL